MYWKKNKTKKEDLQIIAPLILNSQSQMTGDFIIHTDVKIDGYVEGNVLTTKSVIIGENGHLKGKLKCNMLMVFGSFEGISEVAESACLQSTSEYKGELNSPVISVLPGSRVNASINIDREAPAHAFEPSDENQAFPKKSEDYDPDNKNGPGSQNSASKKGNSFLFSNLKK